MRLLILALLALLLLSVGLYRYSTATKGMTLTAQYIESVKRGVK